MDDKLSQCPAWFIVHPLFVLSPMYSDIPNRQAMEAESMPSSSPSSSVDLQSLMQMQQQQAGAGMPPSAEQQVDGGIQAAKGMMVQGAQLAQSFPFLGEDGQALAIVLRSIMTKLTLAKQAATQGSGATVNNYG